MTTPATANETLHGFIYWLKRNPVKSVEAGFTHADLDAMVDAYVTMNTTDATLTSDPLSYGDAQDVPGKNNSGSQKADGAGILIETPTQAICDQSAYPDTHYGV